MINFPERLRSARKAKGWSLQELADHIGNISKQALGKYEQGLMKPEVSTLYALTKALELKNDYFLKPPRVNLGPVSFRKRASLKVKERAALEEQIRDYLDRYLEIEELLHIQHEFVNPLGPACRVSTYEEVEQAAGYLLKKWKLGINPIPNVIETLEDNGVCVFVLEAPSTFDGLATWVGTLPVVVLNKNNTVERRRFTALHELAHILLEIVATDEKEEERFCHRFANAVLLPREVALRELGAVRTSISNGELFSLKKQFGISAQAIMRRALDLGIIKDSYYRYFCIKIAPNRKEESFVRFTFEGESIYPYRFEQLLFRLVAEGVVTESKAAVLGNMSVADLRDKLDPILA